MPVPQMLQEVVKVASLMLHERVQQRTIEHVTVPDYERDRLSSTRGGRRGPF